MTSPVSPLGATPGTVPNSALVAQSSAQAASSTTLDPKAFLQLLVAQLKYQDPASPMDPSALMNQTATLSQVQTMTAMSSQLTSLASAQQTQAATDLIGKQVTYLGPTGLRVNGVVTSASLQAGGATLQVGADTVPLTGVLAVSAPTTP